jgi:hypothetical protein
MAWNRDYTPKLYDAAYEYFNGESGIMVQPDGAVYKTDADCNLVEITEAEWTAVEAKLDEMVAEYNLTSYKHLRAAAYPSMEKQADMQYWDAVNGTTTWKDAITAVKTANPKPSE